MRTIASIFCIALVAGCAARTPTWTRATDKQRAEGDFTYDDAYMTSRQFTNDITEEIETVERLKRQTGKQ